MNRAKALLDSLMGPSRDVPLKSRTGEDFKETNVCKCYLVGSCPTSILGKNCEFLEPCGLLHSVALKEEFERHPQVDRYRREYEAIFLRKLEEICLEADARVAREKRKKRPRESIVKIPEHLKLKMEAYDVTRKEKLREAEAKGNEGDIAGSQEAMKSAEQCQKDIDGILKAHTSEFPGEEVCEACGIKYLMGKIGDVRGYERYREGDIWEDEHLSAKVHKGFVELRAKLAEVREKVRKNREEEEREEREKEKEKEGFRGRDRKDSERRRSRGRDRDRGGDRDRSRGRVDRGRDREKERGRGGRSRSRGRDGDTRQRRSENGHRGRSRSRSRSRARGRSRGRR